MSEFDFSTVPDYKFYRFVKNVFGGMFKHMYHIKFKGLENIPPSGSRYLVAVNHTHALDPVFICIPRQVPALHFMAKEELFHNPVVSWVITHLYGFPVKRGKGDSTAIEYGEKIIETGHVMAICPEGTRIRGKGGVPQRGKKGVAVIAKATKAAVLPVAIYSPKPIKFGGHVTVVYGKLITLEELGLDDENAGSEAVINAANTVMDRIRGLWEAENNANKAR